MRPFQRVAEVVQDLGPRLVELGGLAVVVHRALELVLRVQRRALREVLLRDLPLLLRRLAHDERLLRLEVT